MQPTLTAGIQSAHRRATILRYLLIGFVVWKLIAVGSAWAQHEMLASVANGAGLSTEDASANDARERLVGVIALALFLGTVVCWLMWQYRAYANLSLIGSRDTERSPGASVGLWFIPLANLVLPYQIMSELYRRSEIQNIRDNIGGLSGPSIIGVWWFAYLAWGVTTRFSGVIAKDAKEVSTLITATNIEVVSHVLGIVAAILAIQVTRSIDRFQQAFPVTEPSVTP